MIVNFINRVNELYQGLFGGLDSFVESIGFEEWICDAIIDSVHIVPFLFIVFIFIELFEYYWSDKINHLMKDSQRSGPLIGSIAAIIPQCGFSVIASSLYASKLITRGTLIAIYLATSDEAIPILLTQPQKVGLVIPIILVKLVVAIAAGYLIDFIFRSRISDDSTDIEIDDEGCCKHEITAKNKNDLWLHPLMHTINVFAFVLVITLFLNYFLSSEMIFNLFDNTDLRLKFLEPVVTGVLGLIPNCAMSVAFTMMLIKGTISFGAAMSGLFSNAGLGLLVLLRKNESLKDSIFVILVLLVVSIICGIGLQFLQI